MYMLNEKIWIGFIKQNEKHQSFLEELDVKISPYVPLFKEAMIIMSSIT